MTRRPVRILFLNCPKLDVPACAYLLLSQNAVQSVFEFEICHHWICTDGTVGMPRKFRLTASWATTRFFGKHLWGATLAARSIQAASDCAKYPLLRKELDVNSAVDELRVIVANHEHWLSENPAAYGGKQGSMPTIVITETPLAGQYISCTQGDLAVVTVANWQSNFAPPSALEFLLLSVQRLACRVAITGDLGSHYPTRACLWDFTPNVPDIKAAILVGHICNECAVVLGKHLERVELDEFGHLIRHSWLGSVDDAGSVASNLKRVFKYDLAQTRGVTQTPLSRFIDLLWSPESIKFFYALMGAWILWILARHHINIEFPK